MNNQKIVKVVAAAIAAFFVITYLSKADFSSFKTFTSPEGQFSILLPKEPSRSENLINTKVGAVKMIAFSADTKKISYMVIYADYPLEYVKESNPEILLNGARDGAAVNINGKVTAEEIITVNNCPGREIKLSGPNNVAMRARFFLCENRLYQSIAATTSDNIFDKDIAKFLQSFNTSKM